MSFSLKASSFLWSPMSPSIRKQVFHGKLHSWNVKQFSQTVCVGIFLSPCKVGWFQAVWILFILILLGVLKRAFGQYINVCKQRCGCFDVVYPTWLSKMEVIML